MRNFYKGVLILLLSLTFITPIATQEVLATGDLDVWWKLDETTSGGADSILDSSGNSITATPFGSGGATDKPQPNTGVAPVGFTNLRSLQFDGTDDYISTSVFPTIANSSTYTMSAWVKTSSSARGGILGYGSTSSSTPFITLQINHIGSGIVQAGVAEFTVRDQIGNVVNIYQDVSINNNSWHHVAGVRDGTNWYLYVDGLQKGTTSLTMGTVNVDRLSVGAIFFGSATPILPFSGQIDDVRVYNRALTSAEISNLASSIPSPTPTPTPTTNSTSTSTSSSSNSSTTSNIAACNDSAPSGSPDLFQIDPTGASVKLYFKTVTGANGYQVSYGTTSDANQFGDSFSYSGPLWILDRTINNLSPNTAYYFKVKALNGCNAGNFSQTLSTSVKSTTTSTKSVAPSPVLSRVIQEDKQNIDTLKKETAKTISQLPVIEKVVDKKIEIQKTELKIRHNIISYVVQQGDNLWSIATKLLGQGRSYADLLTLNTKSQIENQDARKLEITDSPNINVGDKLNIDASKLNPDEVAKLFPEQSPQKTGYDLDIKVLADAGTPLSGVNVTLHSTPRESKTDEAGVAHFSNVEGGKHQVFIAYNGYSGGGQSINVTGDNKNLELVMQIKLTEGFSSPKVLAVVIGMGGIIALLILLLLKSKKKSLKQLVSLG